jgi:hypothetical protein
MTCECRLWPVAACTSLIAEPQVTSAALTPPSEMAATATAQVDLGKRMIQQDYFLW